MAELALTTEASLVAQRLIVCDQCGEDFAEIEQQCVLVSVPLYLEGRDIQGETICAGCVERLELTGCSFEQSGYDGHYMPDPLGNHEPPDGWPHRPPGWGAVLEALQEASDIRRLDFDGILREV